MTIRSLGYPDKPRNSGTRRDRCQLPIASREQAMTFHEYLAKARQHDAQQVGERDRLIQQKVRQNRTARRRPTGPAARARRLARLIFRRGPT
jgi:hypothetical protein